MDITTFIANVAEQFMDTDPSVFSAQTKFKELDEWSSLMALAIIAMVDDLYHVRLKGIDIRQSVTVEDLFIKVSSLK
jgi:acyl carrier protein